MAVSAAARPSRRCTMSRSTSARPISSTPDGAIRGMPLGPHGQTGTKQGPCGGAQTVPRLPIIQLAAGMQAMKARR
jgi:hypothetical protein